MAMFLRANGVENVDEEDLLLKFHAGVKEKVEEKPVTKEQRIKEANNFWKAFFAAQNVVDNSKGK